MRHTYEIPHGIPIEAWYDLLEMRNNVRIGGRRYSLSSERTLALLENYLGPAPLVPELDRVVVDVAIAIIILNSDR